MLQNTKRKKIKRKYTLHNKKKKKNQKKRYQETAFIKKIKQRKARALFEFNKRLKKKKTPRQYQSTIKNIVLLSKKSFNLIYPSLKYSVSKKKNFSVIAAGTVNKWKQQTRLYGIKRISSWYRNIRNDENKFLIRRYYEWIKKHSKLRSRPLLYRRNLKKLKRKLKIKLKHKVETKLQHKLKTTSKHQLKIKLKRISSKYQQKNIKHGKFKTSFPVFQKKLVKAWEKKKESRYLCPEDYMKANINLQKWYGQAPSKMAYFLQKVRQDIQNKNILKILTRSQITPSYLPIKNKKDIKKKKILQSNLSLIIHAKKLENSKQQSNISQKNMQILKTKKRIITQRLVILLKFGLWLIHQTI